MYWSPYAGQNANSGNVLLISLEGLVADGLLDKGELPPPLPGGDAAFDAVARLKEPLLALAASRLVAPTPSSSPASLSSLQETFSTFCETNADWLDAAALFHCLSSSEDLRGLSWWDWPVALRDRAPEAMREAEHTYVLSTLTPRSLSLSLLFSMSDVRRPGRTRKKRPNDGKIGCE